MGIELIILVLLLGLGGFIAFGYLVKRKKNKQE